MTKCEICNDEGGVYDRKLNQFTPCECLIEKRNKFQYEKSNLPIKYWTLNIEDYFSQQSQVIRQFLNSRKKIKKDHLIVKCSKFNIQSKFLYLSCKQVIEQHDFESIQIVSFNNLLLEILQQWKRNDSQSDVIQQYKSAKLFFLIDLDLSLLRENMNQLVFLELLQHRENNRLTTIIGSNTDRETICDSFNLDVDCYAEYKLQSEQ